MFLGHIETIQLPTSQSAYSDLVVCVTETSLENMTSREWWRWMNRASAKPRQVELGAQPLPVRAS
jgi:hypothetical protein